MVRTSWASRARWRSISACSGSRARPWAPASANVKSYNRHLRDLIPTGKAQAVVRSCPTSCRWSDAPEGYRHFDARDNGWTKVTLAP